MPNELSPKNVLSKLAELSRIEKQRFVYIFLEAFSLEVRVLARYEQHEPKLRMKRLAGAAELAVRCFDQMRDLGNPEPQGRPDEAFVHLLSEIATTYALHGAIGGGLMKAIESEYRVGADK